MYKISTIILLTALFVGILTSLPLSTQADNNYAKTRQVGHWTVDIYEADFYDVRSFPSITACTKAINKSPALLCVRFDMEQIIVYVHTKKNVASCKKVMYTLDGVNYYTENVYMREFGGTLYLRNSLTLYDYMVNDQDPAVSGDTLSLHYNVSPKCSIPESRFNIDGLKRAILLTMPN